jgi:hypothetical protein
MAVKKGETRREHNPVRTSSAQASQLAAQLAPPEEQGNAADRSANNGGAIIVDSGGLKLPRDFIEEEKDASSSFRPDPVVVLIFFLSLAFIAFITYLISVEPK